MPRMIPIRMKAWVRCCNNAKIAAPIAWAALFFLVSGCRSEHAPNVSHLDGSFTLVRSEQILFGPDAFTAPENAGQVFAQHPRFWDLYFTQVMAAPGDSSASWKTLSRDPYLQALADSVAKEYPDFRGIDAQFQTAFRYLQYYFPGNRVPNVYTLISGFGFFPFIFEDGAQDGLGISLEMFLGSDFPYRTFTGNVPVFSDYLLRTYNRDHLVKKTLDVLVDDLAGPPGGERLVDMMLHNGIKLYILEHLQPGLADTVLFEFTPQQLAWCEANERNLWAHFLTEDLLYASEFSKIQKLINPAPGVPGMPAETPGGVANWTGWKIIHALMRQDPSLTMIDLLALRDAQTILESAKYRPR